MAAHTAGPWTLQRLESAHNGYEDWNVYCVRSPQNVCLAEVGRVDRFESERIEANARLICAAPRMLDALRAVAALANGQGRLNLMEVAGQARAAIADAAGPGNLQPINPPMRTGQFVTCCVCHCLTAFPLADMDGEPFAAYYCPTCAKELEP